MAKKFHSLSRRTVIQFCVFSLLLSAAFGLNTFIMLYDLEDAFIERAIFKEANYLQNEFQQTGRWPTPRNNNMQLHFSMQTLPNEVRQGLIESSKRSEFFGKDGLHYHLHQIDNSSGVYLLAEVSQDLLVRPIRRSVIEFLAVSGVVFSVIACLIAWLISRRITRPLKLLTDVVDGAEPEHLPSGFSKQYPNNEIGILASTIDQSMQRIHQTLAREKAFTRDVSHELRTPLAVIKNATEVHQAKVENGEPLDPLIDRILEASNQMEQTVSTLLMLAREEHALAEKQTVNLMSLVEDAVLEHRHLLEGKDIEIDIHDNCAQHINAQKGMLKVLLNNLLSNAFQYTQQGKVSVGFDNGKLTINDTGSGIEPQIVKNVTKPSVKGSQSTGFGFGLSIVKRLCEHQDWQLSVESVQGTKITVTLR